MGNAIHRQDDSRSCGATTVVSGQTTVFAGGKLVAVNGDQNSDGGGDLIAATKNVFINGKKVVNVGDSASADDLCPTAGGDHCAPAASSGLGTVIVGD
jgi:uncharacterized Zn-binding protein involved in type VI secretion